MPSPNFILLYVASPAHSAAFYEKLLDAKPVETSPTFVMFALDNGTMLGLWAKDGVVPAAAGKASGSELAFAMPGKTAVEEAYKHWRALGIEIAQPPVQMDFGFTFLGLDPDGHRLRAFAPGG
jgi:predicted enzyme related to lactoylglutathione lyase